MFIRPQVLLYDCFSPIVKGAQICCGMRIHVIVVAGYPLNGVKIRLSVGRYKCLNIIN